MFLTLNQQAQLLHGENISSWDFLKYHHRYGAKDNWVTGLKHSACVAAADEWRMEGTEEQSPCMRTSRSRFNELPVSPGVVEEMRHRRRTHRLQTVFPRAWNEKRNRDTDELLPEISNILTATSKTNKKTKQNKSITVPASRKLSIFRHHVTLVCVSVDSLKLAYKQNTLTNSSCIQIR